MSSYDRALSYGAQMTGHQNDYTTPEGQAHLTEVHKQTLDWTDERLHHVTTLRLISDLGLPFWDVSYCHGVDVDNKPCRVQLPFDQLPKRRINTAIVSYAKQDGVYAKGLGIFDAISTLQ